MLIKFRRSVLLTSIFCLLICGSAAANPRLRSEMFVRKSLQTIVSAQITYSAVFGNGNFGTSAQLSAAGFIDSVLADGDKYGFHFVYSNAPGSGSQPARFTVTATPQRYGKGGKTSFFVDQSGELRGGDRGGMPASVSDPFLEWCAIYENERCAISDTRSLSSAQIIYQATYGGGNFGTSQQLFEAGLISQRLFAGTSNGYNYSYSHRNQSPEIPAEFKVFATPVIYPVTGIRSFYIDQTGVLRGADKYGGRADENDPPIDF